MLTSDLVTSIKRRAAVPTAQITFSSTDFYSMIDEETQSKLVPLILRQMEEYYVADFPYNITAGQNAYPMPPRATASMLRDVQYISSTNPECIFPVEKLQIENLYIGTSYGARIQKTGFYLKSNTVYFYPTPTITQDILNLEYYSRPNSCVDPAYCALITAINTATNAVTVSSVPSNITTSTLVDFVKALSGFECTAIDQTISGIVGSVITFSSALPSTLAVGDYICQATQTCVVQAPQELLPLLSQYVTVRVLSSQGDAQALQDARVELKMLEANAESLIAPRVSGKPKRVVTPRSMSRFV